MSDILASHARLRGPQAGMLAGLFVALLSIPLTGAAAGNGILVGKDSPDRLAGQYIVVLNDEVVSGLAATQRVATDQVVASLGDRLVGAHGGSTGARYSSVLRGFVLEGADDVIAEAIASDPAVDFVQVDQRVELSTTQTPATWGLDRIDQRSLPLNNSYTYTTSGLGVHVYVVDTGLRASHSEFTSRKVPIGSGFTAISDGNGTNDCSVTGHGTHVAGTIGGALYGVAKRAVLHPVRVFGCTGGSSFGTITSGLEWISLNAQYPAVVNMSLTGNVDGAFELAVNNLLSQGITVVAAAGNDGGNACDRSPARLSASSDVITVANTDSTDKRNPDSNWGSCVSLFAPGTHILSAAITSDTATQVLTGTSMSAPHVAGAAALYLESNPTASPATVKTQILYAATANVVINTGVSPNRLLYIGFGEFGGNPITTGPAPGTPSDLNSECSSINIRQLYWGGSSGDIGRYEMFYSPSPSFPGTANMTWHGVSTSMLTSSTGWYGVRACNGTGCSAFSNVRYVVVSPNTACP